MNDYEKEYILSATEKVCQSMPFSVNMAAQMVSIGGAFASVGISPKDILTALLAVYPHHAENVQSAVNWIHNNMPQIEGNK